MADNIRESLSALIDGEASEIELHRLLREIGQDDLNCSDVQDSDLKDSELKKSWAAYQQIRSVMGNHPIYSARQHLELSRQISTAIEAETDFAVDTSPLVKNNRYIRPLGGLAIAASITLAVMVGFNQSGTDQTSPTGQQSVAGSIEPVDSPVAGVKTDVRTAVPVQLVANSHVLDPAIESDLRELPPDKQQRLRAYLSRYDRQFMDPQTRNVVLKDKKAP